MSDKIFKEAKLFGKEKDGEYLGRIEQIGTCFDYDTLFISNRKTNLWIFSIFNGYGQLGLFEVNKPHDYSEGQDVIVEKKGGKIIKVYPEFREVK